MIGFPEKLRNARLKKDLTQKELAALAGVHAIQVSHLENGKNRPTTTTLKRLSKALGVGTRDLADVDELANAVKRKRK